MCNDCVTVVKTTVDDIKPFPNTVGVPQGSALGPFLFNIVLDTVTVSQDQSLWMMIYADDIALIDKSLQRWSTK